MVIDFCFLVAAFIVSAILGKVCIPVLKKLKVGQNERKEGPRSHLRKQGTPTMGGIMMIITLVLVTLVYVIGFIKDLEASKSIIAGITEIKAGKSSPLILNLITLPSNKYHPAVSPGYSATSFPDL